MKDNEINLLSDEIRAERVKRKLSQEDMAKTLKISVPTYRDLEYHPNKISLEQGLIINYLLNWNIFDFIMSDILQNAIKDNK